MTVAATPFQISSKSQESLLAFHRQCYSLLNQQWNIREQFRQVDLQYMREKDFSEEQAKAKIANKYGDPTKFQNMTVPVVKPLVEAAVTYQTAVFLTGEPLFEVVADPQYEDEALQMSAVIDDQATRGCWVPELINTFRDGFKYNICGVEVAWDSIVTAALETDLSFSTKVAKPKEILWEGNVVRRLDMYNTFFDSRVSPHLVASQGEFAGYTKLYTRIGLKAFIAKLPSKIIQNIIPAFESGLASAVGGMASGGIESYYIPPLNNDALIQKNPRATTDWMAWAGMDKLTNGIQYKNMYEVTTLYARILPSDFNIRVPGANTPQVWKFLIVNHQVIIYAERLTNAHGLIPMLFCQPYEDGLDYQTKSLANDVTGMQELSTALANSVIASRRRAISDRVIYDPSRISEAHINNPNPAARIPVRPSAYGKNVAEAVYQFPFRDDQAQLAMSELQQIQNFAFVLTGQNQAKQGQFVKGNKTLHEYEDVMTHANGRDQLTAIVFENRLFTPLKEIIKINNLQYQGGTTLYNRAKQKAVAIDPVQLRKATLNFKLSDGLIPADKQINADAFKVALQVIGSTPSIQQGYNFAPMFSYIMKTQGADLKPFEKTPQQVAYEQAMQQWQMLAQTSIEKGLEFKIPQPKPQDYGYDPSSMGGPTNVPAPVEQKNVVNNYTNVNNAAITQE
jgi:hypothetical protein